MKTRGPTSQSQRLKAYVEISLSGGEKDEKEEIEEVGTVEVGEVKKR